MMEGAFFLCCSWGCLHLHFSTPLFVRRSDWTFNIHRRALAELRFLRRACVGTRDQDGTVCQGYCFRSSGDGGIGGRVLVYWSVAGALGRRRARSRHRIMDLADRFLAWGAYRLRDALRVRAGHGRLTARPAEEH
jgi:hypothetical protein